MIIKYYLPRKNKRISSIMVSLSWEGQRLQISTGASIETKHWNFNKQRAKNNYQHAIELNNLLNTLKTNIINQYLLAKTNKNGTSKAAIKEFIINELNNKSVSNEEEISFMDLYKSFIVLREKSNQYNYRTIQRYRTTLHHIQDFEQFTGIKFSFDNLTKELYGQFKYYLNSEKELVDNTVGSIVKTLKIFLNWTYENHYLQNRDFAKYFKVISKNSYKISLTRDELEQLEKYKPKSKKLQQVKDIFLIQCFTSLRYSDVIQLNSATINKKENLINIFQKKTKDYVRIPIHKKLKKIIDKYPDYNFPIISNQKFNEYVKELCKEAGIDALVQVVQQYGNDIRKKSIPKYELVSSHTGRRTCITLLLKKGMLPEEIMRISGHKSRKSFEIYVKISEQEALKSISTAWDSIW